MSAPVITTAAGHEFSRTSPTRGQFTVTAGIPLLDALQSVSDLLSTIGEPIYAAAMGEQALEHNAAWLVTHTLESAKSVVDSLIHGIEFPDSPADQRATE